LVIAKKGKPVLLDSYDAERRPVAKALLEITDAATRRGAALVRLRHPIVAELRNQLMGFIGNLGVFRERLAAALSMFSVHYAKSPIVAQDQPALLSRGTVGLGSPEAPTLLDWATFGAGPSPGDRAPDVTLAAEAEGRQRLFDLTRGTKHTLLIFDGAAATP